MTDTIPTRPAIVGAALPNIPWEDRPAGSAEIIWRSARNPIIPRDLIPTSNSIFNSAVVPFAMALPGVFRSMTIGATCNITAAASAMRDLELDPLRIDFCRPRQRNRRRNQHF